MCCQEQIPEPTTCPPMVTRSAKATGSRDVSAKVVIEDFKDDHNHRHRHSSLGYLTPAEYAAQCTHNHQPVEGCEID